MYINFVQNDSYPHKNWQNSYEPTPNIEVSAKYGLTTFDIFCIHSRIIPYESN